MRMNWLISVLLLAACSGGGAADHLPYLGKHDVKGSDVVHYRVPDYELTDQDSTAFLFAEQSGKVRVADFFFTTCPTICPIMKRQMLRIHEEFREEDRLLLLSHSIDPKRDSVAVLNEYANQLGIDHGRWRLLAGPMEAIESVAKGYLIAVAEDEEAPGGYIHSGAFALIDPQDRIRGFYDGTQAAEVDQLMIDIRKLLDEME